MGFLAVMALSACTVFDVALLQPTRPFKEKVVEGEGHAKILLLEISGMISEKGKSGLKEKPSMVAEFKEALQKAEKDDAIAGVVLRINSPGGTVSASDIMHHELLAFKARKKVPIYASIVGLGTSGAYYLASATDRISAHPASVTGSIGVILMRFEVEGLMQKLGVKEISVKSGAKKDMLSPFRPATPEEERLAQEVINSLHLRFVEIVLGRPGNKLQRKELETLADGRIYTADQALAAKLIDKIEYLDETIKGVKQAAGVSEAKVVSYYRPGGYRSTIYSGDPFTDVNVSLVKVGGEGVEVMPEGGFMYLWRP
ncbi:signal peptide peptidase SppA [Geomonas sp. RF6]|uniref:signal peptide peptidase SppA n=1 Tax=Geomonas sp. RF6 TaxID=2897342 RepID=UPI001E3FC7E0|nr:signal peptide peptidase SppA [Geomonas sp. RF6]UFS71746.1 signal peptide peptidase SppA [Geomonas sp. RF6]